VKGNFGGEKYPFALTGGGTPDQSARSLVPIPNMGYGTKSSAVKDVSVKAVTSILRICTVQVKVCNCQSVRRHIAEDLNVSWQNCRTHVFIPTAYFCLHARYCL